MTDTTKNDPQDDDQQDNLDSEWSAAMSEQQAGESANQAQGLDTPQNDSDTQSTDTSDNSESVDENDWAAALAEQTAATTDSGSESETGSEITVGTNASPELFPPLTPETVDGQSDIEMIMDIPVQMSVELGRTRLTIKNILQLGQGSIVELDGLAGEPMDIYVNGYLIAQGEVVVVDDKYGIRVTDIITPSDRINRLNNRR